MKRSALGSILLLLAGPPASWSQQAHRVVEAEPNGTPAKANAAALGDSLVGEISTDTDFDYFAVDIPDGTFVHIPKMMLKACLVEPDGVTILTCNAPYTDEHDNPAGFGFPVMAGGRYFVQVRPNFPPIHEGTHTGPYGVWLQSEPVALGAGDPARVLFSLPTDEFTRITAGLKGELYVASRNRLLRIDPSGRVTTLVSDGQLSGDILVDAFGDVVFGHGFARDGAVSRITPSGNRSLVTAELGNVYFDFAPGLAVGTDGDLWFSNFNDEIGRLDPTGEFKSKINIFNPHELAVSAEGAVYFDGPGGLCWSRIHVIRGTVDQCADQAGPPMSAYPFTDFAFDNDGRLYAAKGSWHESVGGVPAWDSLAYWGPVMVLSKASSNLQMYAHVPYLRGLTFLRDSQGNTTSRLVALQVSSTFSRIVELNGATERVAGYGFAVRFFHAVLDPIPGASSLNPYSASLHLTADATDLTWTIENGTLPRGLTLSATGLLHGTPQDTGSFSFTVRATNGPRSWFAPGTIRVAPNALVDVSVTQVVAALLGGPPLSPAQIELLDQVGNKNGILDVGDLRAYLRSRGRLTTNPASP